MLSARQSFVLLALCAVGCVRDAAHVPPLDPSERLPGGATSIDLAAGASFSLPAANLSDAQKARFYAGRALAHQPWVRGPTTTDARDGLGPLYNARTCLACHVNGGRGRVPRADDEMLLQGVLLLGSSESDPRRGATPDPVYGGQLQSQSIALAHQLRNVRGVEHANLSSSNRPEAYPHIRFEERHFSYPDGASVTLRRPRVVLKQIGYGPLAASTRMSLRMAPPILGAGLLEAIPQSAIDAGADPEDHDGDGVSGRVNWVWDFEHDRRAPGRFGWKANRASLKVQVAAALASDMGITSTLFPEQPCTEAQPECRRGPHGSDADGLEISDALLDTVVEFNQLIAVPARRKEDHPMVRQGRTLFYRARCNGCHTPSYRTGEDAPAPLAGQTIWPYTDLLLHDMGPELADGRPDYEASGSEWRTPPLWGVGLSQAVNGARGLLHDGRARSVEEAILWHGGEATKSRAAFIELDKDDRKALIAFVKSL